MKTISCCFVSLFFICSFFGCEMVRDTIFSDKESESFAFVADFNVTLGTYPTGADLLDNLIAEKFRVSEWSAQALNNPDFPVAEDRTTVNVVVISLLEMGFGEDDLVSLKTILDRGKEFGLEPCSPEVGPQLRLQFIAQPDYSMGGRFGEFFFAMEPLTLFDDGSEKIFNIVRDDEYPHEETDIGLWLLSNNVADTDTGQDRLFDPLDPEGYDLGGRFAFILP